MAVLGDACPPPRTLYDLQRNDRDLAAIIAYLESSELPGINSTAHALLSEIPLLSCKFERLSVSIAE